MTAPESDTNRAIEAVFRIESPRLIAGLARIVRDVGLAEELAQDALVAALEQWPESGVPDNPGAWLMATAKHRAIDQLRRGKRLERKHEELGRELDAERDDAVADVEDALDDDIGDDLLRLVFTSCHPVLATEARVALTLRLLGGLTTDGDRARVPGAGADDRAAHRARQAHARRGARPVRGAARPRAGAAARVGAGGDLPDLQRGLLGDRRRRLDAAGAVRGRAAPRPHPGRAGAARARGARPGRADGDPGLARRAPASARRRADPAARSGSRALGPAADPPRAGRAGARRGAGRRARSLCAAGRDRRLSRARPHAGRDRLGAHRRRSTARSPS